MENNDFDNEDMFSSLITSNEPRSRATFAKNDINDIKN